MATAAERQARFRYIMHMSNMVQVNGWVKDHQAAELTNLIRRLRDNPHLTVGPVRNTRTGKLEKL